MSNLSLSVVVTFLWGSLFTLLFWLGRKKNLIWKYVGASYMVFFYVICVMRTFFPVDFGWQRKIFFRGIFSEVYDKLALTSHSINGIDFTILNLMAAAWVIVSAFLVVRYVYKYHDIAKCFSSLKREENLICINTMEQIYKETGRKLSVTILHDDSVSAPMGMGLFKKKIVVPDNDYTKADWYNILMHEYTHFLKGDLWIKFLSQMCCCVMWWNPLSYFLRKELAQAIEIRCDLSVTSDMKPIEKAEYLQTIVNCLKGQKKKMVPFLSSSLIGDNYAQELQERFLLVAKQRTVTNRDKAGRILAVILFAGMIYLSYSFVFMPSFPTPDSEMGIDEGCTELTPQNTYVKKACDGSYHMIYGEDDDIITEEIADLMLEGGFELICEE